ncbi:Hypothetical predicted protein [Mytilus galloprovincialis]|uniref:Uncharacterized protein n=1 Tax=Mytilus galloprovincialis TaxID=29158 RepID=A0A8B6GNQ8_MYTGA|nr:Hypothetical predicted protein [Mytilus galloprovincialis]
MPNQTVSNNRFPTGVSDTDDDNTPLSQWSHYDAKDIIIRDLKIENREFQNKLEVKKFISWGREISLLLPYKKGKRRGPLHRYGRFNEKIQENLDFKDGMIETRRESLLLKLNKSTVKNKLYNSPLKAPAQLSFLLGIGLGESQG